MLTAALYSLLATQPKPVWTGAAAGYRLEKWSHPCKENEEYGDKVETLYLCDKRGRIVTAIKDYQVSPLFPDDASMPDRALRPFHLRGIRSPLIMLETWTGGAHGSNCYFLWSLGQHPHCLLAYDKNNVNDNDVDFVRLDHLSTPEILSWYDGFAYMFGSAYSATNIPIVSRFEHGRYVDRTTEYPKVLRKAEHECWADLLQRKSDSKSPEDSYHDLAPAANLVALGDMVGNRPHIWRRLKTLLPVNVYRWLRQREWAILRIIRFRTRRYLYPAAFHSWPVTFRPFPTDKDGAIFEWRG